MDPATTLAAFTMATDKVIDFLADQVGKYSAPAKHVFKNASGQEWFDLGVAVVIDLKRAITGGAGRGAETWKWLGGANDGSAVSPSGSKLWLAGGTGAYERSMVHAAILKVFGDKTADDQFKKAMALKGGGGGGGGTPKDETPAAGGGGAGIALAIGAAILAARAMSGVQNPRKRKARRGRR